MATTVRGGVRERAAQAQEEGGAEQERPLLPLLLAALMARREEGEGIQHPLLLAALMARREEGEGIQHPLLLAALMARRGEGEGDTTPAPVSCPGGSPRRAGGAQGGDISAPVGRPDGSPRGAGEGDGVAHRGMPQLERKRARSFAGASLQLGARHQ